MTPEARERWARRLALRQYEPLTAGEYAAWRGMVALMDREWRERNPAAARAYDRRMAELRRDYLRASSGGVLRRGIEAVKRRFGVGR
jgi:hypothetical protein